MKNKFYDERPWGNYRVLLVEPGHWVKRIVVKPGKRLSLQYHEGRSEEWIVVRGNGKTTVNSKNKNVRAGSHIHIGVGITHRIQNTGLEDLIFIEVALGMDLREDDIVRLKDDYGRVK